MKISEICSWRDKLMCYFYCRSFSQVRVNIEYRKDSGSRVFYSTFSLTIRYEIIMAYTCIRIEMDCLFTSF